MNSQGHIISIQQAYQNQMSRQDALALCKTMIQLIVGLQRHRGCTLAILSGDHFFETQLFSIQRDITEALQNFESQKESFLSKAESEQIFREWISIRQQWHKDGPQENFLLHSNLIHELSKHIWQVIERSNQLHISKAQDQLLSMSLRGWLEMMEITAQARGIATHLAVCKAQDTNMKSRLKFLAEQMQTRNDAFAEEASEMDEKVMSALEHAQFSLKYDEHLSMFQNALNKHFIKGDASMDADSIYTLGSHVVHASHQILLTCMRLTERLVGPELEAWIKGETS